MSARTYLLGLIAAALVPVIAFAAYILLQYAWNERARMEREAVQIARQVSLVVEGELANLVTLLEGLSKSAELQAGDLAQLHAEAARLTEGTDRVILLRDFGTRQLVNTQRPYGSALPPAVPMTESERARLEGGRPVVGDVYASPLSGEYRIAVAVPVRRPGGEPLVLAVTVPTGRIRDVLVPAVPAGWTVGVGDRDGSYVTRSQLHDELTGKPGLPEYVAKVVGRSGTFTASNFQGTTLLAGYYRSDFSDWFYTANIPWSEVEAPLWRSLAGIAAVGLVALLLSLSLAYWFGKNLTAATRGLAAQAAALGRGEAIAPTETRVAEFGTVAQALATAQSALLERTRELETVLETVPAAVWFTHDPEGRRVIRNRFAAEMMGVPADPETSFGVPAMVVDTVATRNGRVVPREERPLTRAMRGEVTDNEEFVYRLLDGTERVLLTSARALRDRDGAIVGAVQISLDITERKRGEEQRKLLINELNHRVKNTLAVVQSIVGQTLRTAATPAAALEALNARLASLGKAHDILTLENWSGAELREVILGSLSPHADQRRISLSGPRVFLRPSLALSLSLAFHELATNALKYGALSAPGGTVAVGWSVSAEPGTGDPRLRLEWVERGGPAVAEPSRRGFGSKLIERVITSETDGKATMRFEPDGLTCIFEARLAPGSA